MDKSENDRVMTIIKHIPLIKWNATIIQRFYLKLLPIVNINTRVSNPFLSYKFVLG